MADRDERGAEMTLQCAECAGDAARRAVHDNFYNLKYDEAIPERARGELEEKFGSSIAQMAQWAAEYAEDAALRLENEPCESHQSSRDDE